MAVPRETPEDRTSKSENGALGTSGFDLGGGCAAVFRVLAGLIAGGCFLMLITEGSNSSPTSLSTILCTGFVGIMALMITARK